MRERHASALRRRAEHYRTLAQGPVPWTVVGHLESLAEECAAVASRLAAETAEKVGAVVAGRPRLRPSTGI
jgi:hypothetical protein